MKRESLEQKNVFLILHQVFMIAMAVCLYAYDYAVIKHQNISEMLYLVVAILGFVGAMVALYAYVKAEGYLAKRRRTKRYLDKVCPELLLLGGGLVLFLLAGQLRNLDIQEFSLAGLALGVGTIVFLMDAIGLCVFMSLYRRALRNQLKSDSVLLFGWEILKNYEKGKGFAEVTRKSQEQARIREALELLAEGHLDVTLDEENFHGQEQDMAAAVNRIQQGLKGAVEARTTDEKMKADLITNISHDIKTPLTSIVNYVELLRREELENENARKYIRVIDEKAQRLKNLTEDLVEVSKISSGNIRLEMQNIDFQELLYQTGGEFNERFEQRELTIVTKLPNTQVFIQADGRQLYRALENLYTNTAKYALEKTKVYVELYVEKKTAVFSIRNISKNHIEVLQGNYLDLTERFVRGEFSRTTEGSGLGLSIAKNLTVLMGGKFEIRVEGELFIAEISFPVANSR